MLTRSSTTATLPPIVWTGGLRQRTLKAPPSPSPGTRAGGSRSARFLSGYWPCCSSRSPRRVTDEFDHERRFESPGPPRPHHHTGNGELLLQSQWKEDRRSSRRSRTCGRSVHAPRLPDDDYDWCLLSNITEILTAFGDEAGGLARISAIGARCRSMASLSIDCVSTPWYHRIRDLSSRVGVGMNLDLGLHDQSRYLGRADRASYRFVFSGLTRQSTSSSTPWTRMTPRGPSPGRSWDTPHHTGLRWSIIWSSRSIPAGLSTPWGGPLYREGVAAPQSATVRPRSRSDPVSGLVLAPPVLLHGARAVPIFPPDGRGAGQDR